MERSTWPKHFLSQQQISKVMYVFQIGECIIHHVTMGASILYNQV